jgi:hypothetical protein
MRVPSKHVCTVLFMLAAMAIAANATTITVTASFSGGYPQSITAAHTPFTLNFGTQFTSITSATFSSTFSGDLWDPGELYAIDAVGGQVNLTPFSSSIGTMSLNLSNTSTVAALETGSVTFHYYMDYWNGQTGTVTLSNLTATITGEAADPVPEPCSALLLVPGLMIYWKRGRGRS